MTICISGWLTESSGFVEPWKHVGGDDAEHLAVCWESRQLMRLGTALKDFVAEAGTVELVKAGIMHSALQARPPRRSTSGGTLARASAGVCAQVINLIQSESHFTL